MKILKSKLLFLILGLLQANSGLKAQTEVIKIPLIQNLQGNSEPFLPELGSKSVIKTQEDNVSITKWKGFPCARFVPDDMGKLDDDKYGLEYTSDDIYTLLNSRKMSFAMMFFCLAPHEIEETFDRRIIQIGDDNDFAFRQKDYDKSKGTYKIECRAYNTYLDKSTVDFEFGKWYTVYFDVWDITYNYRITDFETGKTVYYRGGLFSSPSLRNSNPKINIGNKDIYAVDQLNGGVSEVLFSTGGEFEVLSKKSDEMHARSFGWSSRLNIEMHANEDYLLKAYAQIERDIPAIDNMSYVVKPANPHWVVQGNVLQEDDYSSFSSNGDSMTYDAWIDRGSWVTVQAQLPGVTPNDMRYSNIIRVYIEENLTNTDRIDAKEIKIADDGTSLKLLNIGQPVLEMSVYSLDGKKVISVENQSKISTQSLPNAVYILDYKTADKVHHTVKFAK